MAYKLALLLQFSSVHPVFHVSLLRRYVLDPSHVLAPQTVKLRSYLSYDEFPMRIIDHQVKRRQNKEITSVKLI